MALIQSFNVPTSVDEFARIMRLLIDDNLDFVMTQEPCNGVIELQFEDDVDPELAAVDLVLMHHDEVGRRSLAQREPTLARLAEILERYEVARHELAYHTSQLRFARKDHPGEDHRDMQATVDDKTEAFKTIEHELRHAVIYGLAKNPLTGTCNDPLTFPLTVILPRGCVTVSPAEDESIGVSEQVIVTPRHSVYGDLPTDQGDESADDEAAA